MSIKIEFKEFLKILKWPELEFKENEISIPIGKILENKKSEYYLNFYWYNRVEREYGKASFPQIVFKEDFDIRNIFKSSFHVRKPSISEIEISSLNDVEISRWILAFLHPPGSEKTLFLARAFFYSVD